MLTRPMPIVSRLIIKKMMVIGIYDDDDRDDKVGNVHVYDVVVLLLMIL